MPKNKPDKEYYLLFLLIFILAFAFGVVVGCYACSTGDSGDLTVNVVNHQGNPVNNADVTLSSGETGDTGTTGSATFYNVEFDSALDVNAEKGQATNTTTVNFDTDGETVTVVLDMRGGGEGPSKLVE